MKTGEKNSLLVAKERLLRFLKSKAYPVIPMSDVPDGEEGEKKDAKELFIDQLKKSIKDPCIFIHFPESSDQES